MGDVKHADFSGYATKAGLRCSDGRTILPGAFENQDKETVPLVWQHSHDNPLNVLGHAILEKRSDGMYAYAFFNDTPEAKHVKALVEHGDVVSLSIYANQLKEKNGQVFHGVIRELSVVLSGANPGALIDYVSLAHGDEYITLDDEAKIFTGLPLEHSDLAIDSESGAVVQHEDAGSDDSDDENIAEILGTLNEKQRAAVDYVVGALVGQAAGSSAQHSDLDEDGSDGDDGDSDASDGADGTTDGQSEDTPSDDPADDQSADTTESKDDNTDEGTLAHQEGNTSMTKNVFDQNGGTATQARPVLSHAAGKAIWEDAIEHGSFKKALKNWMDSEEGKTLVHDALSHAYPQNAAGDTVEYGVADIEFLFPEAKLDSAGLQIYSRRMEWVKEVLDGVKKLPFAKVRTLVADITADEARAKGYVKGARKVEEVLTLLRRSTGPATIYKKQKLDRDDIIDIGSEIDIVAWLKVEIRLMLEEELARAILVGDGRSNANPDKIKDPAGAQDGNGIRSILNDDPFYAIPIEMTPNTEPKDSIKELVRARSKYRGSGKPTLFISDEELTEFMLIEDKFGRPMYETESVLADKLRVAKIVAVEVFNEHPSLVAILVNPIDYSIGTNKGGEITSFQDFDIDFNQEKYLQETRLSGGLNKPLSALVVRRGEGTSVTPQAPTFNTATNTITIPNQTGVVYEGNDQPLAAGDHVIDETTEVEAFADEDYFIPAGSTRSWTFTYTAP